MRLLQIAGNLVRDLRAVLIEAGQAADSRLPRVEVFAGRSPASEQRHSLVVAQGAKRAKRCIAQIAVGGVTLHSPAQDGVRSRSLQPAEGLQGSAARPIRAVGIC